MWAPFPMSSSVEIPQGLNGHGVDGHGSRKNRRAPRVVNSSLSSHFERFFGRRRTHEAEHNNPTATGDNRYQIMVWFSGWHFHANLKVPQHLRRNVRCPPLQALRRRKTKRRHAVLRPQLREAQTSNHFLHSSILVGVTRHDHHSEIPSRRDWGRWHMRRRRTRCSNFDFLTVTDIAVAFSGWSCA